MQRRAGKCLLLGVWLIVHVLCFHPSGLYQSVNYSVLLPTCAVALLPKLFGKGQCIGLIIGALQQL